MQMIMFMFCIQCMCMPFSSERQKLFVFAFNIGFTLLYMLHDKHAPLCHPIRG